MRFTLGLAALLVGCGGSTSKAPVGSGGSGGQSVSSSWPQTVVLHTQMFDGESLRLADAFVSQGGAADLTLHVSKVISLSAMAPESFCAKGESDSLAEVPSELNECANGWSGGFQLAASFVHTSEESYVIGQSALVKDAGHVVVYRMRVLGDSYDAQGNVTATLEYEPVP